VVIALIENGLYRTLLPQRIGGAEAAPEVFMRILEELAKADASPRKTSREMPRRRHAGARLLEMHRDSKRILS
jgi:hypothetical protein